MKTYMPLDGFRWSCDSDSALCDIPQTNVLGQAGGANLVVSLRLNTFTKIELNKWLNEPFTPPPEPAEEE